MKTAVVWDTVPYSMVEAIRHFLRLFTAFFFGFDPEDGGTKFLRNIGEFSTILHGVITHDIMIFVFIISAQNFISCSFC
jgi:hypothetical protein